MPAIAPAGRGMDKGGAGGAVNSPARKMPDRACPAQASDPVITLPSAFAQVATA